MPLLILAADLCDFWYKACYWYWIL